MADITPQGSLPGATVNTIQAVLLLGKMGDITPPVLSLGRTGIIIQKDVFWGTTDCIILRVRFSGPMGNITFQAHSWDLTASTTRRAHF
jgi:hypothetical protein